VKILKFLHASNFQLHIPVTCWPTPILARYENPVSANASDGESYPKVVQSVSLSLERTESLFFGTLFPELPDALKDACLSAVWKSAERVFDLALEQNVDFLLLTGDVLQPDLTGARGLVFLTQQFNRLRERGISVYWKLERSIEEWMLPDFRFPENVFLFPSNETHIKKFRLTDSPKNIFIASWNSRKPDFSKYDFSKLTNGKLPHAQTIVLCPDEKTFFCVADSKLQNAEEKQTEIKNSNQTKIQKSKKVVSFESKAKNETPVSTVSYVALTENPGRMTQKLEFSQNSRREENIQTILHTPGPIQYRSPDIWEAHKVLQPAGVTVVHLDLDGDLPLSLQFYPTETLGWRFLERTVPSEVSTWEKLENWLITVLKEEFSEAVSVNEQVPAQTFVYWRLTPEKPAQTPIMRQLLQESMNFSGFQTPSENQKTGLLLKALRNAGKDLAACPWTVCIVPTREGLIPYSWEQGESMLSTFLHLSQFHLKKNSVTKNPDDSTTENFVPHSLNLNEMLTEAQVSTSLNILGQLEPGEERSLLEIASILGAQAFAETQEGDQGK